MSDINDPDKDRLLFNALKRSKRIRSPLIGWALILSSIIAGAGAGWQLSRSDKNNTSMQAMTFVASFGLIAGPLILFGRRFLPKETQMVLFNEQGEIRPFILYLRAFRLDSGWHGWMTEPELARVFKRIGVPVSAGRPGERLPPYGFHRVYFTVEDWQESVLEMASRAKCVVLVMGETDGLKWEMQQIIEKNWLTKTILLVPARHHEEYQTNLREQHGLNIPSLQSYYIPPYSPRRFDLCPVRFNGSVPVGAVVVPTMLALPYPLLLLDWLFRLVMWILMLIVPSFKRFHWLIDRSRNLTLNYPYTLNPFLAHFDAKYYTTFWDRFK